MNTHIPILSTGTANTASVCAALERLGYTPRLTTDASDILHADKLILPGVGTFAAAMAELHRLNLVEPLRQRLRTPSNLSTLCICLGLQLLGCASDESPGIEGLHIFPSRATRFAPTPNLRIPQLGWNSVTPAPGAHLLTQGQAYFANSYKLDTAPINTLPALTAHGTPFIAALESLPPHTSHILACQFHPELSGPWGLDLIRRWLTRPTPCPTPSPASASSPASAFGGTGVPPVCLDAFDGSPLQAGSSLTHRIIPCLDCRDGRVVKGIQFQNLRDAGDPAELAARYEAEGADELVILDVAATPSARANQTETIRRVRKTLSIPLTVGGGVRTESDAARLLDAGADKVAVNTAAVLNPTLLTELSERFGKQCIVLAADAKRATTPTSQANIPRWTIVTRSGETNHEINAIEWCIKASTLGAGEILLTSWDRDGTRSGYDLELLRAVSQAVHVPIIASGGAATPDHLAQALAAGADAVLAASIFHDQEHPIASVKAHLRALNYPIRL